MERLQLIVECPLTNGKGKIANLKNKMRQHADKFNAIIDHIKTSSLEETKFLIYADAMLVGEALGIKGIAKSARSKDPSWKIRLEMKI